MDIDAVNVPDGPRASSRLSAMITAIRIQQEVQIETIVHFCCRDKNLISIQSDLLGMHAIGLRNVLVITGDPPKLGEFPDATAVFDLDSISLCKVITALNHGSDIVSNKIDPPTALALGVGANPAAVDIEREIERFKLKVAAGAEYAITQPVFDPKAFLDFVEATKDFGVPIIAGIWPFTSFKNAQFMANEVPGVSVPKEILDRMEKTKTAQQGKIEGVLIAREMIETLGDKAAGFALSAPFGNVYIALAAVGKIDVDQL
jgi:homocysteine S-methyltransferase